MPVVVAGLLFCAMITLRPATVGGSGSRANASSGFYGKGSARVEYIGGDTAISRDTRDGGGSGSGGGRDFVLCRWPLLLLLLFVAEKWGATARSK